MGIDSGILALMMHLDAFLAEYFEYVQSGAVVDLKAGALQRSIVR